MPIVAFFAQFGPWNWLLLAVALFGLEAVVPGIHFVWFGVAAILVGLIALATDFAWQWQFAAFAVASVATVFIARRFARSDNAPSDAPDLNDRGAQYISRTVVVENAIESGRGRVRVADTLWQAEGDDAPAGARVRVTGVRGNVLVVEAA